MDNSVKINIKNKKHITIGFKSAMISIVGFEGCLSIYDSKITEVDNLKIIINGNEQDALAGLKTGDLIKIQDISGMECVLYYFANHIEIVTIYDKGKNQISELNKSVVSSRLDEYKYDVQMPKAFPEYTRSPRQIKRPPTDKVELKPIKEKHKQKKGAFIKMIIPPLVMMLATIVMSIFMARGGYMLVMLATTLVTTVISITNYIEDKKEKKIEEKERVENYRTYLLEKRKELSILRDKYIEATHYHGLTIHEIEKHILEYSNRIYEKSITAGDFFNLSLGRTYENPSYNVQMQIEDISRNKEPQIKEMKQVYQTFSVIEDIPYMVDLKKAHLGIVGSEDFTTTMLHNILLQTAFYHSYHDVEIIILTKENRQYLYDWARWLPHTKLRAINVSGIVSKENVKDQVLASLGQIMKARATQVREERKDTRFIPHYVFIVDNIELIENHSIMEHLNSKSTELGFSLIYTALQTKDLPENVQTILVEDDEVSIDSEIVKTANILMNESVLVQKRIHIEDIEDVDKELVARTIYPLIHKKTERAKVPKSIGFLELFKVTTPKEFGIIDRWQKAMPNKSLSTPLGVKGPADGDIVSLDLHEKYAGPHGLVAGTTGSGKSEILQSYILSMAVNYSPQDVGFLLIDYKGGGMSNLFIKLPHLMGTITNLDGAGTIRALASIKAELKRRQALFNDAGVNNINKYTAKYKEEVANGIHNLEPLPHLIIISDEFAELKKERPEFIAELVSTARVGRSLGVHLILATQKPSGVVDDQIWSNSKFKLALKVSDDSDSREIIGTSDAASITEPGRAYLQVGNNETYELFQSAYSGGAYTGINEEEKIDERIYLIDAIGQRRLFNGDSIDIDDDINAKTELDVVIDEVFETYENLKIIAKEDGIDNFEPVKPWLAPLEELIQNPQIEKVIDNFKSDESSGIADIESELDMSADMGIVDMPDYQTQKQYVHDFVKNGNLAIYGSQGSGKTTALINVAISLSLKNSPLMLNIYVVDFGNGGMMPLQDLPHTADYISFDDNEKYEKLRKRIHNEMQSRKREFRKVGATTISMYNSLSEKPLPAILLLIDNFDVVKEMEVYGDDWYVKLIRDGASLGIFVMITASSPRAVRYNVDGNFSVKIAQYMIDQTEINQTVGRSPYMLTDVKGRGLVKVDGSAYILQGYSVSGVHDASETLIFIRALISMLDDRYKGERPKPIPMLPEKLEFNELMDRAVLDKRDISKDISNKNIVIGLSSEDAMPVYLSKENLQLIVGASATGKTNVLKLILEQIEDKENLFVVDSKNQDLYLYGKELGDRYLDSKDKAESFIKIFSDMIENRLVKYKESGIKGGAKAFYDSLETKYLIIDEVSNFIDLVGTMSGRVDELIKIARDMNIRMILSLKNGSINTFSGLPKTISDTKVGIVLGNPAEVSILKNSYNKEQGQIDIGYVTNGKITIKIKVPEVREI